MDHQTVHLHLFNNILCSSRGDDDGDSDEDDTLDPNCHLLLPLVQIDIHFTAEWLPGRQRREKYTPLESIADEGPWNEGRALRLVRPAAAADWTKEVTDLVTARTPPLERLLWVKRHRDRLWVKDHLIQTELNLQGNFDIPVRLELNLIY